MVTTIVFTSDDAPGKSATATLTQEGDELGIKVEFNPNGADLRDENYGYLNAVAVMVQALVGDVE